MKKRVYILASLLLVIALAGCGASERAREKAAENAIEDAIGGDADVEIDGEGYTVDYGDGAKMEVGAAKWPTEGPAAALPQLRKGAIVSVVTVEEVCSISMEELVRSDFDSYLQEIKDAGFTENAVDMDESDGSAMYMAENGGGQSITLTYTEDSETLAIITAIIESEA